MSRFRLSSILAVAAGILITTGGCSSSATAPEAATAERSTVSAKKAPAPVEETETSMDDGDVTVQSGFISGGSRR